MALSLRPALASANRNTAACRPVAWEMNGIRAMGHSESARMASASLLRGVARLWWLGRKTGCRALVFRRGARGLEGVELGFWVLYCIEHCCIAVI